VAWSPGDSLQFVGAIHKAGSRIPGPVESFAQVSNVSKGIGEVRALPLALRE